MALKYELAGIRLRQERSARGMSLRELSRQVYLTPSAISQIETGIWRPSFEVAKEIADVLDLSAEARLYLRKEWGRPEYLEHLKWKGL